MKKLFRFLDAHPIYNLLLVFVLGVIVLFLRRPDALLTPQFWAEDGKFWYGEAYTNGSLHSLLSPYAGSSQFAMRIAGSLSTILPFRSVPLFFTLVALIIKIIPLLLIHSQRFSKILKDNLAKWLITIFYLFMANGSETHLNLTNIGWHLSLIAFLILIAPSTKKKFWQVFDITVLSVAALTGPFTFFLAVPAIIQHYLERSRDSLLKLVVISAGFIVQLMIFLFTGLAERGTGIDTLQPSAPLLIQIIGKRIFGVTLFGNDIALRQYGTLSILLLLCFCASMLIYAFVKGPRNLKLFIAFTWLSLAASLASPAMSGSWKVQLLAINDRYWFLPSISFAVSLIWIIREKKAYLSFKVGAMLCVAMIFAVSVPRSFRYKQLEDQKFSSYANQFMHLDAGENLCIPVNPDNGWLTCLTKK